jgi:hypothetical protein
VAISSSPTDLRGEEKIQLKACRPYGSLQPVEVVLIGSLRSGSQRVPKVIKLRTFAGFYKTADSRKESGANLMTLLYKMLLKSSLTKRHDKNAELNHLRSTAIYHSPLKHPR